jgi:peptide/nickel transport system permease protein
VTCVGGDHGRRVGFASTASVLTFFSATRWFADPAFGPSRVHPGRSPPWQCDVPHRRVPAPPPVIASLVTAGIGFVFYLFSEPILADPNIWIISACCS